jgi:hypothetical protein
VRELKNDLDQRGMVSAVKLSRKGKQRGGKTFSRGALYCLLALSSPPTHRVVGVWCHKLGNVSRAHSGTSDEVEPRL